MTKTLIVSSDTPEEDMQAAFTIVREAQGNDKLGKIIWYSNFALSVLKLEERAAKIEEDFKLFAEAYNKFTIESRHNVDRIAKIEKAFSEFNKPQKEPKK